MQWELQQINAGGPNWRDDLQAAPSDGLEAGGAAAPAGDISAETPPEFGGGPAEVDVEPAEVPETPPEEPT